MIAIINVSTHQELTGYHDYEVRINRKVITTFEHKKESGMAECLRTAAAAIDKHDSELEYKIIMDIIKEGG